MSNDSGSFSKFYGREILVIYGRLRSSSDLQITQRKGICFERIKFMILTLEQLFRNLVESRLVQLYVEKRPRKSRKIMGVAYSASSFMSTDIFYV